MKKLVLLDSNSLLNRAFYAIQPLTAGDGRQTNAVYGYVNMLMKIINELNPTNIIAAFDLKAPTFRKQMYDQYKAGRKGMPDELAEQLPIIKELLSLMNITISAVEGYEADDLLGTFARQCEYETVIVTGDRDSLQLVSDTTTVWLTKRGITEVEIYTPERLSEDGLTPSQIIDLKALMGDASDNIPGIPGVGEKTAKSLLAEYSTLDGVYENVHKLKGKLKEKVENNKDSAYLSYQLATINTEAPVEYDDNATKLIYPFPVKVKEMMRSLGFKSIVDRILFDGEETVEAKHEIESVLIKDNDAFRDLMAKLEKAEKVAVKYDESMELASDDRINYIIDIKRTLIDEGVDFAILSENLTKLFIDENVKKLIYDVKAGYHSYIDVRVSNYDDLAVKCYLADATKNYSNLRECFEDYSLPISGGAAGMFALEAKVDEIIERYEMESLYRDIELPLVEVLYDMERQGVRVDTALMGELKEKFIEEIKVLSEEIYNLCGEKFNINSPKQLGHILFETLNLPYGKKNKTGGYSTNADVLSGLQNKHPVVGMILRYREFNKLLSTYIVGIEPLLDEENKLHSVFKQTVTATGRLSSTEPNLQNIPIRKPEGRELRKLIIAGDGCKLLCADYSQIELRLLAHFSGDEALLESFNSGADIHSITAAKVFGVPLHSVTSEMRSRAKAVNFGIIYGISDYGLANDVGCTVSDARKFIDKYFETYPKVKEYLNSSVEYARARGYVKTLMNRIRFIGDINAKNFNVRSFSERVAKNMPLQGSASDIIKRAMVDVSKALKEGGFKAKLILQVHDELIIECPDEEIFAVSKLLSDCMCGAAKLRVDLVADVNSGRSWYEAK